MVSYQESNETLVSVKKYCPRVMIRYGNSLMRDYKDAYLRLTIAKMLHQASLLLPRDYQLVLSEAWRPREAQEWYIRFYERKLGKAFPAKSKKEIRKEVSKFVHPAEGKWASGHRCGSAVDVFLLRQGRSVPMMSGSLTFEENALSDQKRLSEYVLHNRRILKEAMERAGFVNYPKEFWHFSYGDIWAAKWGGVNEVLYETIDVDG